MQPSVGQPNEDLNPGGRAFPDATARSSMGTVTDSPSQLERKLEVVVQTGLLLTRTSDLESIVQAATDAGRQLCGAQFGAFFYNVVDDQGESYQLYTLSGV